MGKSIAMTEEPALPATTSSTASPAWLTWTVRAVAVAGVLVVLWAGVTQWGGIVHGYPLYGPLLLITLVVCVGVGWRTRRPGRARVGWRRVVRIVLVVLGVGWIALMAWLRPFTAVQPALQAMDSGAGVIVTESPTQIVLTPSGTVKRLGVFFQPGAKVEARAYVAVLRPLAAAGYPVFIPKQPLGIAFLAVNTFAATRSAHPELTGWVVGGHSLGGTVASMQADAGDHDPHAPVRGLLLYASYPAGDIHTLTAKVLSLSASRDGLATPAKIDGSRANLPADTVFTEIQGAVHAYFGDYGPQPGDGTPTISHDDARTMISADSLRFVAGLSP